MDKVDFDDYAGEYDALLRKQLGFFSKSDRYFAEYKARIAREVFEQRVLLRGEREELAASARRLAARVHDEVRHDELRLSNLARSAQQRAQ